MPKKKKKFPKGTAIPFADFFGMHHEPAINTGYSSDDEKEEARNWQSERERQKAASAVAAKHAEATKQQLAVLLGEERDHRVTTSNHEGMTRTHLEDTINEQVIDQEWFEYRVSRQEEAKRQEIQKKVAWTQFGTQQMLHRANIADKETEQRISLFNKFMYGTAEVKDSKTKHASDKLESDRKKAAERAKAYETRMRESHTKSAAPRPGLFRPEPAPLAATAPLANTTAAKEPEKKGGWWPW